MDLISLFVTLILLAMFAGAMYVGYQKFVVQGNLFETPAEVTTPTPTESSLTAPGEVPGGVAGVDNMRGRPTVSSLATGSCGANSFLYYGNTEDLLPAGEAKTSNVCKEFAASLDINNWGWDRQNKSCFAYLDSSVLTAMTNPAYVEGKSKYIVGCTKPGFNVYDGCRDMAKGNVTWGFTDASRHTNGTPGTVMSLEACRAKANEDGYEAFGYRTNRQECVKNHGSCFFYTDAITSLTGWSGNLTDKAHITACTDPSKNVKDGCQ